MAVCTTINPSFEGFPYQECQDVVTGHCAEQQLLCQPVATASLALALLGKGLEHRRTLLHLRRTFTETRTLAAIYATRNFPLTARARLRSCARLKVRLPTGLDLPPPASHLL
jgi:hypothetical protein